MGLSQLLICPIWTRSSASCLLPEPQQQPQQQPVDAFKNPGYSAQVLAGKEMEEAISSTEALALLNTGWQSAFPWAWQCSSLHFSPLLPPPSSSVRYNRTNERSDLSPDRLS